MKIQPKYFAVCLFALLAMFLTGCATGPSSEPVDSEQRAMDYNSFVASVPSLQEQSVGDPAADLLFSGIQGLAVQQYEAFQLLDQNVVQNSEIHQLALRHNELARTNPEALEEEIAQLDEQTRANYDRYLRNQSEILSARILMIPEAERILSGLRELNPRNIASSPMAVVGAGRALGVAMDQARYVTESLQWMRENNQIYSNSMRYTGR